MNFNLIDGVEIEENQRKVLVKQFIRERLNRTFILLGLDILEKGMDYENYGKLWGIRANVYNNIISDWKEFIQKKL